ncbi:MAG: carboxypeptidase-like regulatory domain-containing protein [Terracidiphilus sp.]
MAASFLCSAAKIQAQGYAKIVGTVTDPSGAVVPTATVTATQTKSGVTSTVTTGRSGDYVFNSLLPSDSSISVSAAGFQKQPRPSFVKEIRCCAA